MYLIVDGVHNLIPPKVHSGQRNLSTVTASYPL